MIGTFSDDIRYALRGAVHWSPHGLGARPQDVHGLVVGASITLVVVAISVGLVGAWALTRYVQFLLYGITPLDGPTFGLTSILLSFIVLLASLGPARRASQMDPMKALREE